jgi:hypothetical protein
MNEEEWIDWEDLTPEQQREILNAPCEMYHTPPMDFAFCETHDTTFALGDKCRYAKDRQS